MAKMAKTISWFVMRSAAEAPPVISQLAFGAIDVADDADEEEERADDRENVVPDVPALVEDRR